MRRKGDSISRLSAWLGSSLLLGSVLLTACGDNFKSGAGSGGTSGAAGDLGKSDGGGSGGEGAMGGHGATGEVSGGTGGSGGQGPGGTGGDGMVIGGAGGTGGVSGAGGTAGSTGGGGGSQGGTGGSTPCDGACDGATPVCNEATDTCVECLETTDCDDGVCDTDANVCVECLETGDCETGVCDTEANQCVECLESGDCTDALCDTEQNICVECLGNTDCDDPAASMCDTGVCSPCGSNSDCSHLSDTTVCDADTGECVECTVADESPCGGNSCDPATNECTDVPIGSVGSCRACVADSQCLTGGQEDPDMRCVPMEYNGTPREGGFCLRRVSKTCGRPFFTLHTAVSLSGAPSEDYCGIDQLNVRCEAVVDMLLGRECPDGLDTECGCTRASEEQDAPCLDEGISGLCRTVGVANNQCTYLCGSINDCLSGDSCSDTVPQYCE